MNIAGLAAVDQVVTLQSVSNVLFDYMLVMLFHLVLLLQAHVKVPECTTFCTAPESTAFVVLNFFFFSLIKPRQTLCIQAQP